MLESLKIHSRRRERNLFFLFCALSHDNTAKSKLLEKLKYDIFNFSCWQGILEFLIKTIFCITQQPRPYWNYQCYFWIFKQCAWRCVSKQYWKFKITYETCWIFFLVLLRSLKCIKSNYNVLSITAYFFLIYIFKANLCMIRTYLTNDRLQQTFFFFFLISRLI